jgi:hypothetical protein
MLTRFVSHQGGSSTSYHPKVSFLFWVWVTGCIAPNRQFPNVIKKQLLLPLSLFKVNFGKFYLLNTIRNNLICLLFNILVIFSRK